MLITDFRPVAEWVQEMTECSIPEEGGMAIGWTRDGEITCGVMYEHYTGTSITATIAKTPGAVMPPGFIRAIFGYPFSQLGCRKLLAYIEDTNWKSRELVEKMGFREGASISDVFPTGAMIIYSMLADDCRWLEKEDGKED
jgi:hypothetical protein